MSHSPADLPTDGIVPVPDGPAWSWSDADTVWEPPAPSARYQRGTVLSESAMSTVCLAEDPLLKRQVVIKQARADSDSRASRRLLREARITAALQGPGVVPVLDLGVDEHEAAWFAMPVLRGETLATRRTAGAPLASLLPLLIAAARVLQRAHALGIVHRDVKLENILVEGEDEVMLLDWGIARPEQAASEWDALLSSADQTAVGQVLGTPETMSPEQVIGAAVDRRADVWALGVCLVELVSGQAPFARASPTETMRAVVHAELPVLGGALGPVLARCLQRDPAARFPDAGAVADALEAALQPEEADQRPTGARRLVAAAGLGVVGGALLVAAAVGLQPPEPEVEPGPDLALVTARALATRAARDGDRTTAELLAAEGLRRADDPTLRGVLAAEPLGLEQVAQGPLPSCVEAEVSPDGRWLVCTRVGEVRAIELTTGRLAWSKPLDLAQIGFSRGLLLGWTTDQLSSRAIELSTGEGRPEVPSAVMGARALDSHSSGLAVAINPGSDLQLTHLETGARCEVRVELSAAVGLSDQRVLAVSRDGWSLWSSSCEALGPRGVRVPIEASDVPWTLAASADGAVVAEGSLSGVVRVSELASGTTTTTHLPRGVVRDVALSADGAWVAAVDENGRVWLWPRGQGAARVQLPESADRVGFPENGRIVTIGRRRTVWSLPTAAVRGRHGMASGVAAVDWRGELAAAALGNGLVVRWAPGRGSWERRQLNPSGAVAKDVSIGPAGGVLAGSVSPGEPSRWLWLDAAEDAGAPVELRECRRVVWLGDELAVCQPLIYGPRVRTMRGETFSALGQVSAPLVDMEPVAGADAVVMIDTNGQVWQLSLEPDPTLAPSVDAGTPGAVAMAADGAVYVGQDWSVVVFPPDGAPPSQWAAPGEVRELALSPSGELLAAGLLGGDIAVWRTADGGLVGVLPGHRKRVSALAFDPSGERLLSGSWDHTLRTWDLRALQAPREELVASVEQRWPWTLDAALAW